MNPTGLDAGTRENKDRIDLNRDYSEFHSGEIRQHVAWVQRRIKALDLALHLHEDWEATGFYLYELNFGNESSLSKQILDAAQQHLPIETAEEIDGHPAADGIIRPESLPDVPEGLPEAIYFQKNFGGLNYTLETPSSLALPQRIAALKASICSAIR